MFVCLYVCMFVCLCLIQIHISEPIGTKLRTRLPRVLEETVGYVWAHNIPPSPPFRPLPLRGPAWRCAKIAAGATGYHPKRYIRDSDTCSCYVTHTSSRRAAYSYCANRTLWVVYTKREEDNGTHACKRGNRVTLRGAEWLHWLANPHSHVRVCVASMGVYISSINFSTCFVVSADSRVCVCVCLNPRVVT